MTASAAENRPSKIGNRKPLTVALLGNPNTGKTTLFNALAGMRQRVGNYPGVTVETKKGRLTHHGRSFDLIDLPGTYSLAARSPDEMVAVDLILGQQPGEPRRSDRRIEDEGHHDGEQQVAERMDQRVEAVIQVGVDISIGNTESECPAD